MANMIESVAAKRAGGPMGATLPGGGGPNAVDPALVEKGRGLIQELTMVIAENPPLLMALQTELQGFGQTVKQLIGGGQQAPPGGGQPGMPPPQPGMPMGGAPPGAGPPGMPPGAGGGMPGPMPQGPGPV